jgi:cryptochrome
MLISLPSFHSLFVQYYRCYSPVAFGKKSDANGDYIRKYLPQLAKYPAKFIYEPWKAPLSVQQDCGCVIGKGYPKRIVDHDEAVKENMGRMKAAYASQGGGDDDGGDDEDEKPSKSSSSAKITPKGKAKLVSIADLLSPPQKKKNSNN